MGAAVTFNFILLLLFIHFFTTLLTYNHQLTTTQAVAVSVHKGEGLVEENVDGKFEIGGRKLLGTNEEMKKQKLVDIKGEISKRRNNLYHRKAKMNDDDASGFVAFNADYHFPRHHPPKNN